MKALLLFLSFIGVGLLFLINGSIPHSNELPKPVSGKRLKPNQIPIDPNRWYQVANVSNGLDGLFDGVLEQPVYTGYGKLVTNYDAYYPLREGETMRIDSIRLYDYTDINTAAPLTLSIITDTWQRIPIARFVG